MTVDRSPLQGPVESFADVQLAESYSLSTVFLACCPIKINFVSRIVTMLTII